MEQGANTHTIQIPAGTRLAKIMVYWADPAAATEASRALINDLDLTVTDPGGLVSLPWILDPTPEADLLDAPAVHGRDSLNNMEQVAWENPVAGTYTVTVHGTEVPLGPQGYVLVWQFESDAVKLTYPTGGEGFVPLESQRIHWDTYGDQDVFTLRYSTNNGQSFNDIALVSGDKRFYNWTVPNTVSGRVRLMISRGAQSDTTDFPLSIAPVPANLQLKKVCLDSISFSWNAINDTLHYEVYLLGQKYMQLLGTSDTTLLTAPFVPTAQPVWYSARAMYPDGPAGRRTVAKRWEGGLLNCPQVVDLHVGKLEQSDAGAFIRCSPTPQTVTVRLYNEGLNPISGATLHYRFNNDPPVAEPGPGLTAGDSTLFTFQTPYIPTANGPATLRVWSTLNGDPVFFNDTTTLTFPVVVVPENDFFKEGFQSPVFPPPNWTVVNPDNSFTWEPTPEPVTGSNGNPTHATYIHLIAYNEPGQEDFLYMVPVDLTALPSARLVFDVAHAQFDPGYVDGLRVEIYSNCDLTADPVVVYHKTDPELATVPLLADFFTPTAASDWRTESVDLAPFADGPVIIRFVSENGYGNELYLDNIGIVSAGPAEPVITVSATPLCVQDTVQFSTQPQGPAVSLTWSFGAGAQPATANGAGPHSVIFLTDGTKNVRVIATNSFGSDTTISVVSVLNFPQVNFTFSQNDLTVTFTNASANADTFLWNFGDGFSSTEQSPVHTYAGPGAYTVTLAGTNVCETNVKSVLVNLTVGTRNPAAPIGIRVLPNPSPGDFKVELDSPAAADVRLSLFDAQGRRIRTILASLPQGHTSLPFTGLDLPKGLYHSRSNPPQVCRRSRWRYNKEGY